jgi:hypothetical protein
MSEREESKEKGKCLNCGATSDEKPLLPIEIKEDKSYVCVRCLPILIHG